jgi:hypothetical protein
MPLETLIERIYLAPDAPRWFAAIVRSVVTKYELDFPVDQSHLGEDPLW